MDILNNFGFDPKLFVAQVINFLVLAFIFKMFLYKPILKIIKEREEKIKTGLDNAAQSNALLAETNKQREEMLKSMKAEAQDIIDTAKKTASDLRQEILDKAKAESEKIIAQAQMQAAQEMQKMESRMKALSMDLSQKVLLSVLPELLGEQEKEKVLARAVDKLGNTKLYE